MFHGFIITIILLLLLMFLPLLLVLLLFVIVIVIVTVWDSDNDFTVVLFQPLLPSVYEILYFCLLVYRIVSVYSI